MPSRMLHSCAAAGNADVYYTLVDRILATADTMVSIIQSTLIELATCSLPWRIYCQLFSGLPFFGTFGKYGFEFSGFFRTHALREPAFWSKEILLDLRDAKRTFKPEYVPPDASEYTPIGNGSYKGIIAVLGREIDWQTAHGS